MEGTVGEIRLFSGDFAPLGWALCHGQMLNISDATTLYSVIGAKYGGDGRTSFALPTLYHVAFGDHVFGADTSVNYIICVQGEFPQRN